MSTSDQIAHDFAKALEDEIQSKQVLPDKTMPNDFAFVIHDGRDPHDEYGDDPRAELLLTREFDGEKIKVKVQMPNFSSYDDYDDDSDGYGGGFRHRRQRLAKKSDGDMLRLVVEISKRKGRFSSFDVSVVAGNVTVESVKVEVPSDEEYSYFRDPDTYTVGKKGSLQGALREYLKARGIEKSTTDFLYDYMLKKSNTKPTVVLKKVLNFIKK